MKNLIKLLIVVVSFSLMSCGEEKKEEDLRPANLNKTEKLSKDTQLSSSQIKTVKLSIPSIHCEGCEQTITEAANEVKGVVDIKISKEKIAVIQFDPSQTEVKEIKDKIEEAGYDSEEI